MKLLAFSFFIIVFFSYHQTIAYSIEFTRTINNDNNEQRPLALNKSYHVINNVVPSFITLPLPYYPLNHYQNIYPLPSSSFISPIDLYSSSLITTIQWNPKPTAIPIYLQYVTEPSTIQKIRNNMFSKKIETIPTLQKKSSANIDDDELSVRCQVQSNHQSASENYPVYVLPPKNFQPIIYQQTNPLTGLFAPIPLLYQQQQTNKTPKSPEELWYESRLNDRNDLKQNKNTDNQNKIIRNDQLDKNKIRLVPASEANLDNLPLLEASVIEKIRNNNDSNDLTRNYKSFFDINPYSGHSQNNAIGESRKSNKENRRQYKTKLPVGLTSFFLGSTRDVSGRHWHMPATLIDKLEFMPNLSSSINTFENEYRPDITIPTGKDQDSSIEKEDDDHRATKKKRPFNSNTIVEMEDLEAQESSTINIGTKILTERNLNISSKEKKSNK